MTDRAPPITDDLLHAYVDGYLDEAARRDVERHLAQHADAADRVRAWQAINQGLLRLGDTLADGSSRTFDWKRSGGGGQDERAGRRSRRRPATILLRAAAVAASVAIGALGGWYGRTLSAPPRAARTADPSTQLFVQQANVAYRLFASPIQARPVEITSEERDRLQRWLSGKMGLNFGMRIPELTPLGWTLLGGRMLADAQGPAALYVYEDGKKNRLALYVVAMPGDAKMGLTWTPSGDSLIADWGYNRLHMALAGDANQEQLKALLGPINQQIVAGLGLDPADGHVARLPDPPIVVSLNPHR